MNTISIRRLTMRLLFLFLPGSIYFSALAAELPPYELLLAGKDIRPGLVVVLPCVDVASAVGLSVIRTGVVHGLTLDSVTLETARRELLARRAYGRVSLDLLPKGQLPYATASANAVIVADLSALANRGMGWPEILRITAPFGVILIHATDSKPIQAALPGHTLTPVAAVAGWYKVNIPYPQEMDEWTQIGHDASGTSQSNDQLAGPPTMLRWVNGPTWEDYMAGSLVSANGRLFSRHSEIRTNRAMLTTLTAYDAFNGYQLWSREITGYGAIGRQITAGNRVYTVLSDSPKLVALDAATGETVRQYEFTPTTDLRFQKGILLNKGGSEAWDATTGQALWKAAHRIQPTPRGNTPASEVTGPFAIDHNDHIFTVASNELVCCDLATGHRAWSAPLQSKGGTEGIDCTSKGIVLTLENPIQKFNVSGWPVGSGRTVRAYSATDGKFLWERQVPGGWVHKLRSFYGNELALFSGDQYQENTKGFEGDKAKGSRTLTLDLLTGKEQRTLSTTLRTDGGCLLFNHTAQWLMTTSKSGVQLINVANGSFYSSAAIRGNCAVGVIPANGLLYQGLNFCKCLTSFRGDAAFAYEPVPDPAAQSAEQRLEKGPAFAQLLTDVKTSPDDWPIFRGDAMRRNSTTAELPEQLALRWQCHLPVTPSAAIIVGKQAFCALPEIHAVCALEETTGKQQWLFTTAARVDSSPTFHRGRVVFGSRDGWLYCLDAATGELAWRYFLAPADHRMLVRGQIESNWPLFGSPIITDAGIIFTSAGRHTESGGGISCAAIDIATGAPKWQSNLGSFCVSTNPAALLGGKYYGSIDNNDLLFFDGSRLLLPHNQIDAASGKAAQRSRRKLPDVDELTPGPLGLLDEANLTNLSCLWHLNASCRGRRVRACCLDEKNQWALGRAGDSLQELAILGPIEESLSPEATNQLTIARTRAPDRDYFVSGLVNSNRWAQKLPHEAQAKAILRAGNTIYVSAVLDEPAGIKGALCRFDATTGTPRDIIALPSPPVFEGLSVGQHSIFVATQTGLCCIGNR